MSQSSFAASFFAVKHKGFHPETMQGGEQNMEMKQAELSDFDIAFAYIQKLWTYNRYDRQTVYEVYQKVLSDENSFAFFVLDEGAYRGFCHGDYFQTFWMSGLTCYISSIITNEEDRGKGYGVALMDHAVNLAREKHCRAVILDSGFPREKAHAFYEKYGFEKSCYGFEMPL